MHIRIDVARVSVIAVMICLSPALIAVLAIGSIAVVSERLGMTLAWYGDSLRPAEIDGDYRAPRPYD